MASRASARTNLTQVTLDHRHEWGDEEELFLPPIRQNAHQGKHPSVPLPGDEYDDAGRNLSAQARHQEDVPWTVVTYKRERPAKHQLDDDGDVMMRDT
tara:strand:- start:577 stop:870 length:294 start_codon:yes stop_codon:yes gene_type:complete